MRGQPSGCPRPHTGAGAGGLEATYDDHLRLIEKRVVDLLLVLIELLVGVTAEALYGRK